MDKPAASQRQRPKARRAQILRRRLVAAAALVALVALAVWGAYSIPGLRPARVPKSAALPTYARSPIGGDVLPIAHVGESEVLLPLAREVTTAIAFRPVDNEAGVAMTPVGERLSGGGLGTKLADIFADGGGVQYYLMDDKSHKGSPGTAGLDVGGVPGSKVVSPVDGRITAVKLYKILGRYADVEIDIQLKSDASLLLVLTHIEKPTVKIGDIVKAGKTPLGTLRGFPSGLDQALSRYTSDNGDHVQLLLLRVSDGPVEL